MGTLLKLSQPPGLCKTLAVQAIWGANMPGSSSVTEDMMASACFKLRNGKFQLSGTWGPNRDRCDMEQQTDWKRVCCFSTLALILWVNRLEQQFRKQHCDRGARCASSMKRLGDHTGEAQLLDPIVTFRSACIFGASMQFIVDGAVWGSCMQCWKCRACQAYQACLDAYVKGSYDAELAVWCQDEWMSLHKLSFVTYQLEEVYKVVVSQLAMEQAAFRKRNLHDSETSEGDMKPFKLCRPRQEGLQWVLPIVSGVDQLWSSLTAFRQRWEKLSFDHCVTLKLNPSGRTFGPAPESQQLS